MSGLSLAQYVEKRHPFWVPNAGPYPANRIKEIRDALGLSQGQLARRLGMEPAHLGKIENGRIKLDTEKMERIASELAVAPGDLLHDSGRPPLSRREYRVLTTFRQLSESEQDRFLRLLNAIEEPSPSRPRRARRSAQG